MDMFDTLMARQLGAGGGGGTTNYNALSNKPEINGETLQGDKSSDELKIAGKIVDGGTGEIFNDYSHNVASGVLSHAEGGSTTASGDYAHTEGGGTAASGNHAHAEGADSVASGNRAHAEGITTTASGNDSHAEGGSTTASGVASHAEGYHTTASAYYAHAEGGSTTASANFSHAEGNNTKASSNAQHVQGKYNIEDNAGKYAFIIGNGTADNARSNALAVDWNGDIYPSNYGKGVNLSQIDTDVEVSRLALDTELYGFKIDKQDSNPATRVTYLYDAVGKTPAHMDYTSGTFNYGGWADAWFIRENKPCALRYNGTVAYYLNPNDYTQKEDGTASDVSDSSFEGNFMAQLPTIWIKRWEDANYLYVALSNRQIDSGFKAYAHDAGDGYVNDYIYLPMFKGAVVDSKLRSIAGVTPQGMTTAAQDKANAEACGSGWQTWDWSKHCVLTDLLTLISCNTNSQDVFGAGAVNTRDDEDEQTHGMLTTGTSGGGQFYGTDDMLHHVKVFHVEDYWGNRYDTCLGLNRVNGNYMCKAVRPYSVAGDSTYTNVGTAPTSGSWAKSISVNEHGWVPSETGGTSSTYYCDMLNLGNVSTNSLARIGGMNGDTSMCGSYLLHISRSPSDTLWFFGASPVYNPPHSGFDDKVDEEVFDYVQPQIDTIREILGVELYGFRIDKQDSNPATRVAYMYDAAGKTPAHMDYTSGTFDYGDWANAWFVRENKPCALKYDGSVDYYLNPNDYTKKADGTASDVSDNSYAGNFMATMPTVWTKYWEDSRYIYVAFSNKQINDSYHAYAHDAGDGFINDFIYLPMFKGAVIDSKLRSIAGQYPTVNNTATVDRTAAVQCGTGWDMWPFSAHTLVTMLATLISKTTNTQVAFGIGVARDSSETTHDGAIQTGLNDLATGQFYGVYDGLHHVKLFHIEDYWGNRFERSVGLHLVENKYVYKLTPPYTSSGSESTYTLTDLSAPEAGYLVECYVGEFGLLPKVVGGSGFSAKYFCDNFNVNSSGTRTAIFGGFYVAPGISGGYFISLATASGTASTTLGASPVYIPPHST